MAIEARAAGTRWAFVESTEEKPRGAPARLQEFELWTSNTNRIISRATTGPASRDPTNEGPRRAIQHAANQCWLVWSDGPSEIRQQATIEDFSILGARIETNKRPSSQHDLKLQIQNAKHLGELSLEVVKLEKSFLGPYHARCMFETPADYEMFKAVVYGIENIGRQPEHPSRDWDR